MDAYTKGFVNGYKLLQIEPHCTFLRVERSDGNWWSSFLAIDTVSRTQDLNEARNPLDNERLIINSWILSITAVLLMLPEDKTLVN